MKQVYYWLAAVCLGMWGCGSSSKGIGELMPMRSCDAPTMGAPNDAVGGSRHVGDCFAPPTVLLATHFESLEALQSVVRIDYFTHSGEPVPAGADAAMVRVVHCAGGYQVTGILRAGLSQDDLTKAQQEGAFGGLKLAVRSPYAVAHREELQQVMSLARRRQNFYGEGDVAFFDFAETMVRHVYAAENEHLTLKDSSEKGYLNTFNHVTAQAMITSLYSEELANFVGDLHELKNMPSIVTGKFTAKELTDPDNNPVDNYVDIVNNEWGQELGKWLAKKYAITQTTCWTPALLANYVNDLQSFYGTALEVGFGPFSVDDPLIIRMVKKINFVMGHECV